MGTPHYFASRYDIGACIKYDTAAKPSVSWERMIYLPASSSKTNVKESKREKLTIKDGWPDCLFLSF